MWDGQERRSRSRLTDEEKREIAKELAPLVAPLVRELFELDFGRGTLTAIRRVGWTACAAGIGYVIAQIEKWFK